MLNMIYWIKTLNALHFHILWYLFHQCKKNDVIDEPDILTALPTPHRLKDEKQNSEYTKLINYDLNNLIAIISLKDILTPNSLKLEDLETKGKRYWFFKLSVSISKYNIT